ncbi:MAG TPA: FAD-binding protein [Actinophytocola sp.]|uniref:FAD-binding protein n=1 Tax=Actinophytocola sp. TaxID=1872138 RepID=UPI002DBD1664|nr:FAD-binding protein [Actinophytocola sp.]HEU5472287.1 FAD-binding protein [Actinophytocola sp.]
MTATDASTGAVRIPGLDGELVVDPEALREAGADYGQIVHRRPVAVLRPASVRDIVTVVRFANRHGIAVSVRGQGHSVYGQAQVRAGIVVDSRTLATIHRIGPDSAVVDAGVRWTDLIRASLAIGRTSPVNTDYIGLSVGGTLSVGGIGGASSKHGLQVDTVRELEVVTGDGRLVRCSERDDRELFRAVLGGLGQFAIIVRATVGLVPAETTARTYRLSYPTVEALTADQRRVLADGRFDYLEGQVVPLDGGGWSYLLEGAVYYTAPNQPHDPEVLAGLHPIDTEIVELPYFDWLDRITEIVDELTALRLPNPWINLFLPDAGTDDYVARAVAELTPADTGGGPVLLYPVPRARLTRPFVRVPDSETVFLFAVLRMVLPPDPAEVDRLLRVNRTLYERARDLGATQYAIGAIPMTNRDWARHFGEEWPAVERAKARFDPRRVLNPGQRIFED